MKTLKEEVSEIYQDSEGLTDFNRKLKDSGIKIDFDQHSNMYISRGERTEVVEGSDISMQPFFRYSLDEGRIEKSDFPITREQIDDQERDRDFVDGPWMDEDVMNGSFIERDEEPYASKEDQAKNVYGGNSFIDDFLKTMSLPFQGINKIADELKNMTGSRVEEWKAKKADKDKRELYEKINQSRNLLDDIKSNHVYQMYNDRVQSSNSEVERNNIREEFSRILEKPKSQDEVSLKKSVDNLYENIDIIGAKSVGNIKSVTNDPEEVTGMLKDLQGQDENNLVTDSQTKERFSEKIEKIIEAIENLLERLHLKESSSPSSS